MADWLKPRVLELTYTAWDLAGFAADLGYHGPPFRWDPERRELIRAELDAAFFHLYGLDRDEVDYVMDTFPIVRRKDEAKHGEYRTKRLILDRYDALAAAIASGEHTRPSSTHRQRMRYRLREQQMTADASREIDGIEEAPDPQDRLVDGETVVLADLARAVGEHLPSRDDVEPHLAALLQAEHLNLLIGSGLTSGLAHIATFTDGADMGAKLTFESADLDAAIERNATLSAATMRRGTPNIEDRLRVAIAAADGLRLVGDNSRSEGIQKVVDQAVESLRQQVAETEVALVEAVDAPAWDDMTLRGILMSFLGSFAGRAPTRDRLHVFTTNYDRVIEWGAELSGLRIVDRFVGSLEPVFRSSLTGSRLSLLSAWHRARSAASRWSDPTHQTARITRLALECGPASSYTLITLIRHD